jgi:preprotein translocase subunit SecF
MRCPFDFTYLQASGGQPERCVHKKFADRIVSLNVLPKYSRTEAEPTSYNTERQRVNSALNDVRSSVQALEAAQSDLERTRVDNLPFDGTFKSAQAQFSGYTAVNDMANKLKETTNAMQRPRQPTAPRKDIVEERQRVLSLSEARIKVVQVALLTVLVCMVVYLVLPFDWAHGVAFLVACVGIAVGIFLTST